MRYKLVIFDFDGTLADSFGWLSAIFNEIADRFGFRRIDEAEGERLRGLGARQIVRELGIAGWKIPFIAIHVRRRMAADLGAIGLFPGVDAMLRGLAARGVAIAVVSSNSEANVRRVLGPELAALVTYFGCGAGLWAKPAKFRKLLRRAGVAPHEALAVGDELRDQEAARQVGLAFGAATWGFTTAAALRAAGPDWAFGEVAEIVGAVGDRTDEELFDRR